MGLLLKCKACLQVSFRPMQSMNSKSQNTQWPTVMLQKKGLIWIRGMSHSKHYFVSAILYFLYYPRFPCLLNCLIYG